MQEVTGSIPVGSNFRQNAAGLQQSPEGVAAAKAVLAGLWDLLTSVDRTPAAM